jgi:transglutaminase-like putative cysteine protease
MDRREFLRLGVGAAFPLAAYGGLRRACEADVDEFVGPRPPAYSVIPVVGDGKWIWTAPPKDQTGYLEPRRYEVRIGIEMQGNGPATKIKATTPVPVESPEQKIDEDVSIDTLGCRAAIRKLDAAARELVLTAPSIVAGQVIRAVATFQITLFKQYHGFNADAFYRDVPPPKDVRRGFLQNSPGIETSAPEVSALAAKVAGKVESPWERAERFKDWVWENIAARPGKYTNVTTAIKNRVGDCEERAAVFVALCRSVGIPARLVWVPNHNWAEFYLTDIDGKGHWIPAHTSCYSWFGWTGAHELVLQKGDRIPLVSRRGMVRLQEDWAQWQGKRPAIRFLADLRPLPSEEGKDAGPGARRKDKKGEWLVTGEHELDRRLRDGERIATAAAAREF